MDKGVERNVTVQRENRATTSQGNVAVHRDILAEHVKSVSI